MLQFVTVHRVRDGKIVLWKDYWDFGGLVNHAPPDWMEQLATADTSWIFDATGLIPRFRRPGWRYRARSVPPPAERHRRSTRPTKSPRTESHSSKRHSRAPR